MIIMKKWNEQISEEFNKLSVNVYLCCSIVLKIYYFPN